MKKLAFYTAIACVTFVAAFGIRTRQVRQSVSTRRAPPPDAPDSMHLAALGIHPGEQLVAYAFGGSRCGFCQKAEVKKAFAILKPTLRERHIDSGAFESVRVVGVAIDVDVQAGLGYLESISPTAFDEVSVGSGWQNEHVVRLLHQQGIAETAVPLVIVISRTMAATLAPLTMTYGRDSVRAVIQGASRVEAWLKGGARLDRDGMERQPASTDRRPRGPKPYSRPDRTLLTTRR